MSLRSSRNDGGGREADMQEEEMCAETGFPSPIGSECRLTEGALSAVTVTPHACGVTNVTKIQTAVALTELSSLLGSHTCKTTYIHVLNLLSQIFIDFLQTDFTWRTKGIVLVLIQRRAESLGVM